MEKNSAQPKTIPPMVFEHDLKPFVREAVTKAEEEYPDKQFTVEVEMTEEMILKIVVVVDTPAL